MTTVNKLHKMLQTLIDEGKGDFYTVIDGNYLIETMADLSPKKTVKFLINDFKFQRLLRSHKNDFKFENYL